MKSSTAHSKQAEDLGLVASGASGPWMVALDQTTSGAERWFLQIKGPLLHIYVEMASIDVIGQAANLFSVRSSPPPAEPFRAEALEIGELCGVPVLLIFDDEFADRCFYLVDDNRQSSLRFAVAGEHFASLAECTLRARDELRRDGWLAGRGG